MENDEVIKSFALAIISSGLLNALTSHLLYSKKLEKENTYKANEIISKDIGKSLKKVRELEYRLKTQEIYDAYNEFVNRGSNVNMFEGECIYPEIFNDWNSYNDYMDKIQECRKKYESFLSCKVALNLVYIDRYIRQLCLFMTENGDEKSLPTWGVIFFYDLQIWQKKIDKLLIKEINKHEYKLESHETIKWKILRKIIIERDYKKTILCYFITGKCRIKDKRRYKIFDEFINDIKNDYNDTNK